MSSILDSLKKSQQLRDNTTKSTAGRFSFGREQAKHASASPWRLALLGVFLLVLIGWGFQDEIRYWVGSDTTISNSNSSEQTASGSEGGKSPFTAKTGQKPKRHTNLNTAQAKTGNAISRSRSVSNTGAKSQPVRRPDPQKTREKLLALANQSDSSLDKRLPAGVIAQEQARLASNRHASSDAIEGKSANPMSPASQPHPRQTKPSTSGAEKKDRHPMVAEGMTAQDNKQPHVKAGQPRSLREENTSVAALKTATSQPYRYRYQLSFSVRKNLPELRLSIHIYDQEPQHRMVVINGQDMAIGDTLEGSEVVVKDIVPEGALLSVGGEVFLLPNHR